MIRRLMIRPAMLTSRTGASSSKCFLSHRCNLSLHILLQDKALCPSLAATPYCCGVSVSCSLSSLTFIIVVFYLSPASPNLQNLSSLYIQFSEGVNPQLKCKYSKNARNRQIVAKRALRQIKTTANASSIFILRRSNHSPNWPHYCQCSS